MFHLISLFKTFLSSEEHIDNKNIEFTIVDADTVKIKDNKEQKTYSINIRVFNDSQLDKITSVHSDTVIR